MLSRARYHLHIFRSILIQAVDVLSLYHCNVEISDIIIEIHAEHFDSKHER